MQYSIYANGGKKFVSGYNLFLGLNIKKLTINFYLVDFYGGDEVIRTPDPRVANAMLCQLSYIPTCKELHGGPQWTRTTDLVLIRDAL